LRIADIKNRCTFVKEITIKKIETMTTTEIKSAKLQEGYKVWDSLSPIERYNKVMINFSNEDRKGVNGLRKMAQFIIDNNITK
jgi:hypothetical protein